ncbi:MAG: hypothetical protein EHM45_23350 [Desulfobacteraceae bacterium]|nr:MAG: hypothetical protein EHM45_23350 [Desulfobacteraceae bacterium]
MERGEVVIRPEWIKKIFDFATKMSAIPKDDWDTKTPTIVYGKMRFKLNMYQPLNQVGHYVAGLGLSDNEYLELMLRWMAIGVFVNGNREVLEKKELILQNKRGILISPELIDCLSSASPRRDQDNFPVYDATMIGDEL